MLDNRDVVLNEVYYKQFIVGLLYLNVYADGCCDKEMGTEMNRTWSMTSKELTAQWGKTKESMLQEKEDKET